jgi:hypothetical protein
MIEGVDFSFARPGAKALLAAGKHFVVRYLPYALGGATDGGKGLTAAEIKEYRAAGLDIVLNFEWYAARMKHGHDAGLTDGRASQAAFDKLGIPNTLPVYFSADWDATSGEQAAIDAYLKGAASVLGAGRVGVYGSFDVINRCRRNGTARWFWQTYAWSGGRLSGAAHLYQYHNGQHINGAVDLTRALVPEFGQWHVGSAPLTPEDAVRRFIVPEGPQQVATVKAGTWLYVSSDLKPDSANVQLATQRPLPYIGKFSSNPDVRIVAYEGPTPDDDLSSWAMFVPREDIVSIAAPTAPTPAPEKPASVAPVTVTVSQSGKVLNELEVHPA